MLSIVVAIAENNVIGKDGKLIWHIPRDLRHFRQITEGGTVIMGRKTFESLPHVLENRKHIILTRNTDYKVNDPDVTIVHSMDDIKPYKDSDKEYYVIGGGELFKAFLPHVQRMYITWVGESWEGDTHFPEIPAGEFILTEEWEAVDELTGIPLTFANYDRAEGDLQEQEWEQELEGLPN